MGRQLLKNAIKTPDGTVLESTNVHDYRTYVDKNGLEYMVDGGLEYLRRNIHNTKHSSFIKLKIKIKKLFGEKYKDPLHHEELALYSDDNHEDIRNAIYRSGYGRLGDEKFRRVLLKDMSNDWLCNVIVYEIKIRPENRFIKCYQDELYYRFRNDILILDKK